MSSHEESEDMREKGNEVVDFDNFVQQGHGTYENSLSHDSSNLSSDSMLSDVANGGHQALDPQSKDAHEYHFQLSYPTQNGTGHALPDFSSMLQNIPQTPHLHLLDQQQLLQQSFPQQQLSFNGLPVVETPNQYQIQTAEESYPSTTDDTNVLTNPHHDQNQHSSEESHTIAASSTSRLLKGNNNLHTGHHHYQKHHHHHHHSERRKSRWRPTQEHRQILEEVWEKTAYPDSQAKARIIEQLGGEVTQKQITSWFKHKRENDKSKGKFEVKFSPAQKFSADQVDVLEQMFNTEPYAKGKTLQEIADRLGVELRRVQNWFKHKRSRLAQQGKFTYKPRNTLNPQQITFLRGAFFSNPSPVPEICESLSQELNVNKEQITRWFSNERSKKRRKYRQMQQQLRAASEEEEEEWSSYSEDEVNPEEENNNVVGANSDDTFESSLNSTRLDNTFNGSANAGMLAQSTIQLMPIQGQHVRGASS